MDAPSNVPTKEPLKTSWLSHAWIRVVQVPQASAHQKGLAQFVAAVSMIFGVTASLIAVAGILARTQNFTTIILLAGAALFFVAFALNRSGRYRAAVWMMLGTLTLAPYVALLSAPKDIPALVLTAALVVAVILYMDELLSERGLVLPAGAVTAVLFLIVPLVHPVYNTADVAAAAASIALISLLYWLRENLRTWLNADKPVKPEGVVPAFATADDLNPNTVSKLEHELRDLRIELQATVDEYERVFSEAEQAKEEAERANYVKSSFLASMSHELRTPLNAIINLTKFVVDGDLGPISETQQETLREVVTSGKHLLNLINDVLDMSKIESGSLSLFIEDNIELKTILQSVFLSGKGLLAGSPVELTLDVADNVSTIRGDRQRITQIILNIMANACKFTQQGSIKLKAYQNGDDVVISIQDTGPGMAPDDQTLVYEAFKQTDAGLRHGGGTGLGMPISKNLAEAHGGRLWFESEIGKGSTFYVSLPVKSQKLVPLMGESQDVK